jgi:aminodeoxyfutalosine deaminase
MMRTLTADAIFSADRGLILNGILVLDDTGTVVDLFDTTTNVDLSQVQKLTGVLCPGFINTHLHLELSHLRGHIAQHTGFVGFAKELMQKRNTFSAEETAKAMADAEAEMYRNGIVAAGDISNTNTSFAQKKNGRIYWHTFIELIGLSPTRAEKALQQGIDLLAACPTAASLAPHAPYTASRELLRAIAAHAHEPFTIHNQESLAENEFFQTGTGRVRELYEAIPISLDFFTPPQCSSLRYALPELRAERNLLLVHNTFTPDDDLIWAIQQYQNLFWCFCPKANLYIENSLPDFAKFHQAGARITIGTDSLASNDSLSVLDELKIIAQAAPEIPTTTLLTWATKNGADFLNIAQTLGTFERGKKPGVNLISGLDKNLRMCAATQVARMI